MAVKIITDTLSDITGDLAKELDLTVIPLYVRFGEEIFRDRVEITSEQFYQRLVYEDIFPSTTQPTPNDFLTVYEELSKETDEILVIVVSSKLSGTYQSATQAKDMLKSQCRINIVDSLAVAMTQGLIVIAAVNAVKNGANLDEASSKKRSGLMSEVAKLLDLGFVAESEGQMCGFIVGRETYVIERDAEVGEIAILGIHPDFQGKGIATKLVDAIIELFKSRGITIVRTRLHPDDKIMSGFFERVGFAGEPLISYSKAICNYLPANDRAGAV